MFHASVMIELLRNGADPNLPNKAGETPLHIICSHDYDKLSHSLRLFLIFNDSANQTVHIDAVNINGCTPLHYALWHNKNTNIVESLLRRGANPNLASREGLTALHYVHDIENAEMLFRIAYELDQPLLVNAGDKDGFRPLHHAVLIRNKEVAKLLLRKGAKPNLANKYGVTPLHMIWDDNFTETFLTINEDLNLQVEIDAQDIHGFTPLHYARYHKQPRGVKSLLKRGAGQKMC
ncbi:ankyrin-1-like [Trichogramma pretiosum]|uniref:ankyrin-1-like n=1 Tax=Trichogramma pretiosum TaxID=7493 RepID=UPI000C71B9E6|nr:ankyrin-1-like [Trichogramma pretiosum]